MIFFEVKLIHPETKEVYFKTIAPKADLPSKEVLDKYPGALLIINTLQSNLPELKKTA